MRIVPRIPALCASLLSAVLLLDGASSVGADPVPLPAVPAVGSNFQAPPEPVPKGSLIGTTTPFIGITLDDAVTFALVHDTDLAISESNRRIAGYRVVAARGPFDVKFALTPSFVYQKIPALSPFESGPGGGPTTQLTSGLQSSLGGETEHGTRFSLSASAQRVESNSTSNAYNPYYPTALSFTVTQPLLRGSGLTADRRELDLAIANAATADATASQTASATVVNVQDTYYDLVAAWRNLGIQEQALDQIRAQAASNDRLVRRGAAAPVDVVEANTQVDVYQGNVYAAIQSVSMLQNRLKALIISDPSDPLWSANLVPISPVAAPPPEPKLERLVIDGLLYRPEFSQLRAARKSADLQVAYAKDQSKPQLDLQLGYTASGFAGQSGNLQANPIFSALDPLYTSINSLIAANPQLGLQPVPAFSATNPANTVGRFGQSFTSLFQNQYPTYSAQLNLGIPLRNDAARGEMGQAVEQERQVDLQQTGLIQRLIMDSRNGLQALDTARFQLISAHGARLAADRVLAGEVRKFRVGESTTFLVLQREVEAANDQGRELTAQTNLDKAIVELDRVTGVIFRKHGISLTSEKQAGFGGLLKAAGISASDPSIPSGALAKPSH